MTPEEIKERRLAQKRKANRRWYLANPEGAQRWRKVNPEKARDSSLRSKYGITQEQRTEIFEKQGGACAICRARRKLCVDHCHETGQVRGLLCGKCNTALGQLGDSLAGLRRATRYLIEHGAAAKAGVHKNG